MVVVQKAGVVGTGKEKPGNPKRLSGLPHGDPELCFVVNSGRIQIAQTEAEECKLHAESTPGPTQHRCVGLVGRRIGFLTHPCLTISKSFEATGVDVPVRKQVRWQDGDRHPAGGAEETREQD